MRTTLALASKPAKALAALIMTICVAGFSPLRAGQASPERATIDVTALYPGEKNVIHSTLLPQEIWSGLLQELFKPDFYLTDKGVKRILGISSIDPLSKPRARMFWREPAFDPDTPSKGLRSMSIDYHLDTCKAGLSVPKFSTACEPDNSIAHFRISGLSGDFRINVTGDIEPANCVTNIESLQRLKSLGWGERVHRWELPRTEPGRAPTIVHPPSYSEIAKEGAVVMIYPWWDSHEPLCVVILEIYQQVRASEGTSK